jgi:uncharacterized membrane protein
VKSRGFLIGKRNWFIGIRTPWTMSDENVWDRTHKVGGRLFKIIGIIAMLGVFFGKYSFLFIIIPVILIPIFLIVFSYLDFKNIAK